MTAIIYLGEMLVASLLAIVLLAISQHRVSSDAGLFAGGIVAWTFAEYVVHRFVLHGIAPTELLSPRSAETHAREEIRKYREHFDHDNGLLCFSMRTPHHQ
jgi:hypothetical protein